MCAVLFFFQRRNEGDRSEAVESLDFFVLGEQKDVFELSGCLLLSLLHRAVEEGWLTLL